MSRIPTLVQRQATRQNRLLSPLLDQCGDLDSARNELRWLSEHAAKPKPASAAYRPFAPKPTPLKNDPEKLSKLEALVKRRAAGEPLQYIIGDQPFGELEILCEPNVLIPRLETEIYTTNLVKALFVANAIGKRGDGRFMKQKLRILDICTGSGAIGLLLHQLLREKFYSSKIEPTLQQEKFSTPLDLQILGIDVSLDAVRLARKNLEHNLKQNLLHPSAEEEVIFREFDATKIGLRPHGCKQELANILGAHSWAHGNAWDVLVCNPPYIAPSDYAEGGRTEKSVRNHEPQLALVPPQDETSRYHPGDTFYPNIMRIALKSSVKVIVMEVGDTAQATRVKEMAVQLKLFDDKRAYIETWYDDGTVIPMEEDERNRLLENSIDEADEARKAPEIQEKEVEKKKDESDTKWKPLSSVADRPVQEDSVSARAVVIWRGKWANRRRQFWNPPIHYKMAQPSAMTLLRETHRKKRWALGNKAEVVEKT